MTDVQDTLLGSHLITRIGVFIDRKHMMNYISWIKYPAKPFTLPPPAISKPKELWTGAQLVSMLLPPTMILIRAKETVSLPQPSDVVIKNGELLCGYLSKATLGSASNGIIDVMYRDFGASQTVRFMADIQRVVNQWLLTRGFSVGIQDCVLGEEGLL